MSTARLSVSVVQTKLDNDLLKVVYKSVRDCAFGDLMRTACH